MLKGVLKGLFCLGVVAAPRGVAGPAEGERRAEGGSRSGHCL